MNMNDELAILQAVRLKGRVSAADVAATLSQDPAVLADGIDHLVSTGMLIEGRTIRISQAGRDRLAHLLAGERHGIDSAAIAAAYHDFRGVNFDFKAAVSDWQLRDGQPNNHEDAQYDAAVLTRLDQAHEAVLPVIAAVAVQLPRLSRYADKLCAALQKIKADDTTWFTRPMIDSYHTVWFELHEELILAAGLTRDDEAKAGDA